MNHRIKRLSHINALLLGVLTLVISAPADGPYTNQQEYQMFAARVGSTADYQRLGSQNSVPDTHEYRVAKRLKTRLTKNKYNSPDISVIANAIRNKQKLLQHSISIELNSDNGEITKEWDVSLQHYPTWLVPKFSRTKGSFEVNEQRIIDYMNNHPFDEFMPPVDVTLNGTAMSGSILRAKTDGIAAPGYEIDLEETAAFIKEAFDQKNTDLVFTYVGRSGSIFYNDGLEEKELTLLGQGKSNYKGSTWARSINVSKAINEHVNNVIVEPDSKYSFVETLDAPVTLSKGWRMAKVIYNGGELRPSPGGGICQASTTVYRAIVNAGLPVVDRRSHSLYVSYYKEYGVGIDATVYPGTQDLSFINDTGNPIIIQAFNTEDKDAVVNFYGIPDGREVVLEGPFFSHTAPTDVKVNQRDMRANEIVWTQNVIYPSGYEKRNLIVSQYKSIPKYVSREFTVAEEDVQIGANM
ncbi:MAG: VanW family protein [Kiritimatiellales bacterium]|nr:VanW family protein [Kiritimatiellales bacterium]